MCIIKTPFPGYLRDSGTTSNPGEEAITDYTLLLLLLMMMIMIMMIMMMMMMMIMVIIIIIICRDGITASEMHVAPRISCGLLVVH